MADRAAAKCSGPLRLALLGGGAVSRLLYLPALQRLCCDASIRLEVVVDPSGNALAKLQPAADQIGAELCQATFEEFFRDGRWKGGIDAAIVALPHHLHEASGQMSLAAGLHVFCEKPLGLDQDEVERMIVAAREAERILAVCQPRRSYPAAVAIRRLLQQGWMGPVTRVTWHEGQPYAWPAESLALLQRQHGGEEVFDIGAHVFDLLIWWLGSLQVCDYRDDARGGSGAEYDIHLQSDAGVQVDVSLSRLRTLRNTVEIACERGRICWNVKDPAAIVVEPRDWLVTEMPTVTFANGRADWLLEGVREQLGLFSDAVRGRGQPVATGQDALEYAKIFTACRQAQRIVIRPDVLSTGGRLAVVTGASGFIGCRLVERLLADGDRGVRALVHRPQSCARLARNPVDMEICDVRSPEVVQRGLSEADVVFHCTGSASCDRDTIVEGTLNVLRGAEAGGVRRVVVFSSMLAYGDPPANGSADETLRQQASGFEYGRAKREMERQCVEFARKSRTDVVILEPTCVFGPFGSDFVANQLNAMLEDQFFVVADGAGTANLVYVDNLLDAAILAADASCTSGTRYIVNEEEWVTTWAEYFGALGDAVLGLPASDFPSLSLDQLEQVAASRRKLRSFPMVVRQALRSDDLARQWLSQSTLFLVWRALKRLRGVPNVQNLLPTGNETPLALRWEHDLNGRVEKLLARLGSEPKPSFDVAGGRFFSSQSVFSSERIRRDLGWHPRVSRNEALQETVDWARRTYTHRAPAFK